MIKALASFGCVLGCPTNEEEVSGFWLLFRERATDNRAWDNKRKKKCVTRKKKPKKKGGQQQQQRQLSAPIVRMRVCGVVRPAPSNGSNHNRGGVETDKGTVQEAEGTPATNQPYTHNKRQTTHRTQK